MFELKLYGIQLNAGIQIRPRFGMVNLTNTHLVRKSPNTSLILDPRSIEFTEPNLNQNICF